MKKKIGKFDIVREIDSGAMGAVYEGIDSLINRKVAIKVIKKNLVDSAEYADYSKRFHQEAQAIGQLHHSNITAVIEYGEDKGEAFIAMTYAEGRNLKNYFDKHEKFSLESVCDLMEQLLDALSFTHKRNIYHRDIKPANIIVDDDGSLMITDFGIARLENSELTQAGAIIGTISYMAPEQLVGERVDGRADIYASGVILYQFLTGEKPFTGSTAPSLMHKIMNVPHVSPSVINMTVPSYFDDIVSKSLAKKRDDRYVNAEEFKRDIKWAAAKVAESEPEGAGTGENILDETVVLGPDTGSAVNDGTVVLPPTTTIQQDVSMGGGALPSNRKKAVPVKVESPPIRVTDPIVPESKFLSKKVLLGGGGVLLCVVAIILFGLRGGKKQLPITVIPDPEPVVEIIQKVKQAQLEIISQPVGANVTLNDEAMSELTPVTMELEEKEYTLVLQKNGYHDLVIVFDGKAGENVNLQLTMHSL